MAGSLRAKPQPMLRVATRNGVSWRIVAVIVAKRGYGGEATGVYTNVCVDSSYSICEGSGPEMEEDEDEDDNVDVDDEDRRGVAASLAAIAGVDNVVAIVIAVDADAMLLLLLFDRVELRLRTTEFDDTCIVLIALVKRTRWGQLMELRLDIGTGRDVSIMVDDDDDDDDDGLVLLTPLFSSSSLVNPSYLLCVGK